MSRNPRNIVAAVLTVIMGSIGVAVNDDGGGGGGVYTQRTQHEMQQLLREYQVRHLALCNANKGTIALTAEEEMQQLHEEAFKAQVAQRQAVAAALSEREHQSWLTRDQWQFVTTPTTAQTSAQNVKAIRSAEEY